MLSPSRSRNAWRGFTLVELLVVVAIIAVLMALLLPALKGARDKAKSAGCLNILRQYYLTLVAYSDDNSGKLPQVWDSQTGHFWNNYMRDQGYGAWLNTAADLCPARPNVMYDVLSIVNHGLTYWVKADGSDGCWAACLNPPRFQDFARASEQALVADSPQRYCSWDPNVYCDYNCSWGSCWPVPVHSGGLNGVFVDGHCDHMKLPLSPALSSSPERQPWVW